MYKVAKSIVFLDLKDYLIFNATLHRIPGQPTWFIRSIGSASNTRVLDDRFGHEADIEKIAHGISFRTEADAGKFGMGGSTDFLTDALNPFR